MTSNMRLCCSHYRAQHDLGHKHRRPPSSYCQLFVITVIAGRYYNQHDEKKQRLQIQANKAPITSTTVNNIDNNTNINTAMNTPESTGKHPLMDENILSLVREFVGNQDYAFFAPVSRGARKAWGKRPAFTRAFTAHTSPRQLEFILTSPYGLDSSISTGTTVVCCELARFGKLTLLEVVRAFGCPWSAGTCASAARGETKINHHILLFAH